MPQLKLAAFVPFMLLFAACASVGPKPKPVATITSYGRFATQLEGSMPANIVSGDIDIVSSHRLVERTREIPCVLGERFGVLFDLENLPGEAQVYQLLVKWEHPLLKSPSGRSSSETTLTWPAYGALHRSRNVYLDWGLEEPFELVSGTYRITVHLGAEKLLEHSFRVACETVNQRKLSTGPRSVAGDA